MSGAGAGSAVAPRTAASLRKRNGTGSRSSNTSSPSSAASSSAGGLLNSVPSGMFKIYTDDSPGIKVDPFIVLIGTLTFIASVFLLHIISKWTRH